MSTRSVLSIVLLCVARAGGLEIDSNTSASKSWPYELSRAPYEVTLYKIQQMLAYRNIQEKGKKIFGKPRWQCNMYMVRFFELRVALAEVMYKDPFLHTIVADLKVKRQSEMNHHNNRPEWVCELYRRGSAVVRAEMDAIVYMQAIFPSCALPSCTWLSGSHVPRRRGRSIWGRGRSSWLRYVSMAQARKGAKREQVVQNVCVAGCEDCRGGANVDVAAQA